MPDPFDIAGLPERRNCCGTCNYRPYIFELPENQPKPVTPGPHCGQPHRCHHNKNMICAGSVVTDSCQLEFVKRQIALRKTVIGL